SPLTARRVAASVALAFGAALATGVVVGLLLLPWSAHHGPTGFDTRVLRWFTARRTAEWTHVARRATWLVSGPVVVPCAVGLAAALAVTGRARPALFVLLAVAGAAAINAVAKWVIGRDPPPRATRLGHSYASSFP